MTGLRITALSKRYGNQPRLALDRLELVCGSGEMLALLGPSGCGKTSALSIIAGLLQPDSGDVLFDGQSVLSLPPEKRGAAMVFQQSMLFPHMTVADNIGFGLRMRHRPAHEIDTQVAAMLEYIRLPDAARARPAELSGGQQQRVALARALIIKPRVLLMDEPLASLDPHLRGEMRNLICNVQRDHRITALLVTHDQDEAVAMADRIVLMDHGRAVQSGSPPDFFERPATAGVVKFFGGANLLPCHSDGESCTTPVAKLRLPTGAMKGTGLLTFRPERVKLGTANDNAFQANIKSKSFAGTFAKIILETQGTQIQMWLGNSDAGLLHPGDNITVHIPPEALWIVPEQSEQAHRKPES